MTLHRTRDGINRLWARRWFRRMTYVLASGALCTYGLVWTVQRPFFNRWLINRMDALLREETGLGLQAQKVEFRLLEGRVILERFAWGGDLLQADRLAIRADLPSMMGGVYHIWELELENPRVMIDAEHLAQIHLKPHPKSDRKLQVQLDRLAIRGGQAVVHGGAWGLPDGEFFFQVHGQGTGPNHIQADLRVPRIHLKNKVATLNGSLSALADLSESVQEIKHGELHLGRSSALFQGRFESDTQRLAAKVQSALDLREAVRFVMPSKTGILEGHTDLNAGVDGTLKNPSWNMTLRGRDIASPAAGLRPGTLQLSARGNFQKATLKDLIWDSSQGGLQGSGEWKKGIETRFLYRAGKIALAPVAEWLRAAFLRPITVDVTGEIVLPGDPWNPLRLNAIGLTAKGRFHHKDSLAGNFSGRLAKGDASLEALELTLPELTLSATGLAHFGAQGLLSVAAEAETNTDAAQVAKVLYEWKIPETYLDMAGKTRAQAKIRWNTSEGIQLTGTAEVDSPKWERAQGDLLKAEVRIEGSDLWVDNIQLEKGSGHGTGNLWLTWRDLPPGETAIDMCYQASRLPIEEGMKASGLEPEFTDMLAITGLGSGWARIHGPYDHLRIEGSVMAEAGTVKGIYIPFASGDMDLDLTEERLSLKDIRIAESPQQLGSIDESPSGDLALRGRLDLDLLRGTWQGGLKGRVDSQPLRLPGPRFQAQTELRLAGPWSVPTFPYVSGALLSFDGGRLFFNQLSDDEVERTQSIEGLHGTVESGAGGVQAKVSLGEHTQPILSLDFWPQGEALIGGLDVHVSPDTADTQHLAASLTQDLLVDGLLDLHLDGRWNEAGLQWRGRMENFLGRFDGFEIQQEHPALLEGDASKTSLNLDLLVAKTLGSEAVSIGNTGTLQLSGYLPFSVMEPLALRLKGQAELLNLKAILDHVLKIDSYSLLGYMQPKGKAQFDLTAGGTYAAPTLDGDLTLNGGSLLIQTYPQSIEELGFTLYFRGRDIELLKTNPLQGRLAQGTLHSWGKATWDFGGLTNYDFHAKLEKFQLRDLPEGFDLQGTLNASLTGNGDQGILQGRIDVDRMLYQAEINLADIILSASLGGPAGLSPASPDDPLANIALDLDVNMNNKEKWEFDTNLLKLQGEPRKSLKIKGNLLEPGVKGVLEIVPGGRITNVLPAGDIILEKGDISFDDPTVFAPRLNLTGRIDISPYVVKLDISGPLDLLEMKMSSTPSLRPEEILVILIDPSQAATIGSSVGQLSQSSMNSGIAATTSGLLTTLALAGLQDSLRRSLRLDRVNVVYRTGTAGNSETDFTVGSHIDLGNLRIPLLASRKKVGDVVTQSLKTEWRPGSFVIQLGGSQTGSDKAGISGEIRHTWIPRW